MSDDRLHPVRKITPMFIDHVLKIFPDIKCIDSSFERLTDGPEQKCYMVSNDSSGVTVYFFNMKIHDVLKLIDEKFEESSDTISEYFSVIVLYNKLLYNVSDDRFNISINIIDNFSDNPEGTDKFRFQAIMQINSKMLIMLKKDMILSDLYNIEVDEDSLLTYSLDLGQKLSYDYLLKAFNRYLLKYNIVSTDLRFDNVQRHADLIQMMKI